MSLLGAHLNSLDFSTRLEDVKRLIETAQVKTTFWGSRVVEVNGFESSVYLDDIASRILRAGRLRSDADDLTPAERIAGLEIVRKLKNFYQVTDAQIRDSNFFTKFLNWIRNFSFFPYSTRFYIEEIGEAKFRAYSEAKFLKEFGGVFGNGHSHPASNGTFGPPFRVLAREDRIRQLIRTDKNNFDA